IKATKQKVFCTISISDEIIEEIKQQTEKNAKFLPEFMLDIVDSEGNLIAKVKKVLYIRRKSNTKKSA
ncbi:MAG: hypothetical protein JG767_1187, partial [Deferribacteraceae bacterium]|nr:hypothetical protein [Deferribacteraceae bacterium]